MRATIENMKEMRGDPAGILHISSRDELIVMGDLVVEAGKARLHALEPRLGDLAQPIIGLGVGFRASEKALLLLISR